MTRQAKSCEIFIVGFDKAFANMLLEFGLNINPAVRMTSFLNGDEALKEMNSRQYGDQPGLLFLNAPLLDSFLWKVKGQPLTRQVPVLVLGHQLTQAELERGYQLNANSIIQLPKAFPALSEVLKITLSYWLDFCQLTHGLSPLMTGSNDF